MIGVEILLIGTEDLKPSDKFCISLSLKILISGTWKDDVSYLLDWVKKSLEGEYRTLAFAVSSEWNGMLIVAWPDLVIESSVRGTSGFEAFFDNILRVRSFYSRQLAVWMECSG